MTELEIINIRLQIHYNQESINPNKAPIVIDGIINNELFSKAKHKILWVLKEPYCDGQLSYPNYIKNKEIFKFGSKFPKPDSFWSKIAYTNYGLLHDYYHLFSVPRIRHNEEVFNALQVCALVNIKKIKEGYTESDDDNILAHYINSKQLILEQIMLINPDIIIFADTLKFLEEEDVNLELIDIFRCSTSYLGGEKLVICTSHSRNKMSLEKFCDEIFYLREYAFFGYDFH